MSDLDDAQLAPISVHKDAWTQKDLLEGIVQRYVTVRSHVGGLWPTWEIESDQLDEKFIELNAYLERLGWMARLRRSDVVQLTTLPLPHRQFPGSRIHLYMWTASIITLLLSAVRWMDSGRPEGGWFSDLIYLDGLLGFALPILGTLLLASYIQTRVSAKFGVRSGHILPIPDPSVLLWLFSGLSTSYFIWPFGIFFIPTSPLENNTILDVHKTHMILGKVKSSEALNELEKYLYKNKVIKFYNKNEKSKYKSAYKKH